MANEQMSTQLPPIIVDEEPKQIEMPVEGSTDASPELISLPVEGDTTPTLPSLELADKRTQKIQYGLGPVLKKSDGEIRSKLVQGQEDLVRREAASSLDYQKSMRKQKAIMELASKKGGPLSIEEVNAILDPNLPDNQPTDPTDVVERAYGSVYTSTASADKPGVIQDATKEIPNQIPALQTKASTLVAKQEFARTLAENIDDEISKQSWIGWGVDQAKTMFQPYNEYKLRGNVSEVGTISGGLLLGTNLEEQADKIFMLPIKEYKERLTKITNDLKKDNPTLAKKFVETVLGTSINDRVLDNIFTILAPMDYWQGVKIAGKITGFNRASRALRDVVKSNLDAGKNIPTTAIAHEGAGNVAEAGNIRAADIAIKTATETINPTKEIKETLTSNFRLDAEKMEANRGSLSREQMTRLLDRQRASPDKYLDIIETSLKVDRTPMPIASEKAMAEYAAEVKRDYPGLENAVLDVETAILEPVTNKRFDRVHIANIGGDLFSNPETAQNFAKNHGFGEVKVVPAEGKVRLQDESLVGSKTDLNNKARLEKSIPEAQEALKKRYKERNDKVNPPTKEMRAKLNDDIQFFTKTIKNYKAQLELINSRITVAPARIEQHGNGFKIVVEHPFKEDSDVIRNYLITSDGKDTYIPEAVSKGTTGGWFNGALGRFRSADDTLSLIETLNRKAATTGPKVLQKWAEEESQYIEKIATGLIREDPVTGAPIPYAVAKPRAILGKIKQSQVAKQFRETVDYARSATDPVDGKPGYFFKSPGELEDHYWRMYDRAPSLPEHEAYFSIVRLVEADRVQRELQIHKLYSRIGGEQHQISLIGPDRNQITSGFFDGVRETAMPGGGVDEIMIFTTKKGEEKIYNLSTVNKDLYKKMNEQIAAGRAKLIRIIDPDLHPLKEFSDVAGHSRIRYVYSPTVETKPLGFNHVPRRGGGHFDYEYDHYLKQAYVHETDLGSLDQAGRRNVVHTYLRDNTIMALPNKALGKDLGKKLDDVRIAIKEDRMADAERLSRKTGIEWEEIKGWFKGRRDANGKGLPPTLSLDEPFYVVPKNQKIYDIDKSLELRYADTSKRKSTFRDGSKSGSDAQQFQVAYTMERDANGLRAVEDIGSVGNPIYQYVPAKMVDPITTMNRSLNRIINSSYMDDYKLMAVEHWLREAAPLLKGTESEIRSAPFWFFHNGLNDMKLSDTAKKWNLESNHAKIRQFLGVPSKFDTFMHGVTQSLVDSIYTKSGPEGLKILGSKDTALTPLWMLHKIKDPIQFMRSVAFNAKLGLFNLPQLFVQAQSHASIFAISPRAGTVGLYAGTLHQYARFNQSAEIMRHLDLLATKLNGFGVKWKPGEWLEAHKEFTKSGFEHVGGEYVMNGDQLQHKFIKNDWNNFLDAGQVFFREGERSTRITAYYTAFKEFRHKTPTGALTEADRRSILNRADLLTNNMTRASASNMNSGVFGLTTQFLTYQWRLAELMIGNRLTKMDKARMVMVYSALYGATGAPGLTGLPLGDAIRSAAIDRGYVVGDNWLNSLVMEGVPAMIMAMISGGGDAQKGTNYNFGGRYGVQGFTQAREALKSDNTIWKLVAGASGNILVNTLGKLDPFWQFAKNITSGDNEDNKFKITSDHFLDLMDEISSYSAAKKYIIAMNTGRWVSKNESYIENISKADALFRTITGMTNVKQDDMFKKTEIHKAEIELQKDEMKLIIQDGHRYIQALRDNDPETAQKYAQNIRVRFERSGFPIEKRGTVMSLAMKDWESQADSVDWKFLTEDVPMHKRPARLDQFERQKKLDNLRKQ